MSNKSCDYYIQSMKHITYYLLLSYVYGIGLGEGGKSNGFVLIVFHLLKRCLVSSHNLLSYCWTYPLGIEPRKFILV